ncbi:hypothetical protein Tco_0688646, partial [Tanacetum coccineum]
QFKLDLKKARKANKEDFILQQRPKGSGEGSSVASEVPDWLNLKCLNEGFGVTLAVPDESSGSSSSSILEYKIKEISSDDKGDEVDDNEKADVENAETDKAEEEHVEDQGGNEQAEDEQDQATESHQESTSKYLATPFDQVALDEYDQKDKLLKMMMKSKSYNRHLDHMKLYDALMDSLLIDENDMDKQLEDLPTQKKRHRDDQDQDPSANSEKEEKKRNQKDFESSKKDKDQVGSSKKGKSPSKSSKIDKSMNAKESVHDVEMDTGESVKDDVVIGGNPTQADAKWHKECTVDDATKQTWFNEMVNVEKNPPTFDDVMVDFFFNKDLEYLTNGNVEKKYATSLTKPKAARYDLEGIEEMISMPWSSSKVAYDKDAAFGIKLLLRVELKASNLGWKAIRQSLKSQCHMLDLMVLTYTIFYEPRGVVYQNKDNKKYMMRANEVYKFGDGTLKKVHDKLDYRLKNFELGYNDGMPKRAWTQLPCWRR